VVGITDGLLDALAALAQTRTPEWGAALLGIGNTLTLAVDDDRAETTAISWALSEELRALVPELESAGLGTFAGTVHAHPGSLAVASPHDIEATAQILSRNPHLDALLVLVVSQGRPNSDNQLALGRGHRLSSELVRAGSSSPERAPVLLERIAIGDGLADAGVPVSSMISVRDWQRAKPRPAELSPRRTSAFGPDTIVMTVDANQDIGLAVPPAYPLAGPVLFALDDISGPRLLPSPWDPARPARIQVRNLVRSGLAVPPPGWAHQAPGDPAPASVLIVGAAGVGAAVADALARRGILRLILVDPGRVSAADISASTYGTADLGEWRVFALARHLREINPAVEVVALPQSLSLALDAVQDDGAIHVAVSADRTGEVRELLARQPRPLPLVTATTPQETAADVALRLHRTRPRALRVGQ
jgi:hypothetical protein